MCVCSDTCKYGRDGSCDDGGKKALYTACKYGTDCTDCGPRLPMKTPSYSASTASTMSTMSTMSTISDSDSASAR